MSQIGTKVTASSIGAVTTLTPDSGGAIAPNGSGTIFVHGGPNIATSGAGNTVTVGFTGTLPVASGGTGDTSLTTHGVLIGEGTSAVAVTAVGSNGQVLIGATAADPAFATLTSTGGTITFTTGANTLNLEADSGGLVWTVITGASQALVKSNGYFANNAGTISFSLPGTAAVGDTFTVAGMNNATGWTITQAAGQTMHFGTYNTTTGVSGSLSSTAIYDTIRFVCNIANTDFVVVQSIGNITVV